MGAIGATELLIYGFIGANAALLAAFALHRSFVRVRALIKTETE